MVLITDGAGDVPPMLGANRRRTVAICIPPGRPAVVAPMCRRVVELGDVTALTAVVATLVPRRGVG